MTVKAGASISLNSIKDVTDRVSTAENDISGVRSLAEGTNEHFWHDNTGAHVTEDTQSDYQQDPSSAGGNALITSQGLTIRKGTTSLASFGSSAGIDLKGLNFNNQLETYLRLKKDDTYIKCKKYVPTQPGMDILKYTQTTQITEDGFVIKRERGSGTAVTAFEVTPSDPDGTSEDGDALLLLQATRDDLQRYPDGGSVELSTSDGEGVVVGYWLNGNFTEKARIDNDGNITATGDIWADGNIEAEGNILNNGNISTAGGITSDGDIESQSGDVKDGSGNVLSDKVDKSSVVQTLTSGTKIGEVDGTSFYAPSGGSGGGVTDVTVDGASVVNSGVAEIDLTGKADVSALPDVLTFYGTNSQSGTATLRTVDVADTSFALERGVIVAVKFTNGVPSAATLNVNSTGAKAIYYEGATIVLGTVKAGDLVTFQYDGSYWNVLAIDRQPTKTSELTNDGDGTDPFATTADLASKINGSTSGQSITLGSWKLCWGSYTTNTSSASGSGTFAAPYYVNDNITFSFSATPYVWAQVQGGLTGSNFALVTTTSKTGATIRLMASGKTTNTRTIRWFAIGQA